MAHGRSYTFLFSHLHLIQNIKICFSTEAKKKHCTVYCTMYVKRINSVIHCWHFTKRRCQTIFFQPSQEYQRSLLSLYLYNISISSYQWNSCASLASLVLFQNPLALRDSQYGFHFVMNSFWYNKFQKFNAKKSRKVFINFLKVFCKNILDNLRRNVAPI